MNTDELEHALVEAERRVLKIQTKLHGWARGAGYPRADRPTPTRARQHCHSRGALRLSFYRRYTLNDDAISEPDRRAAGLRDVPQGLLPPRVSTAARLRCPGSGTEPADGQDR